MIRGDVVICALAGDYGKPRPAVIVQSDLFNPTHASITLCPITSALNDAPLIRVTLKPTAANGLKHQSQIMVDKIVSIPKEKIKQSIGKVSAEELDLIGKTLKNWLDL